MRQMSLFPPDDHTIPCVAVQEENRWYALIAGGWWIAYGKTKKEAISNVVTKFEREWSRYGSTPREAVEAIPWNGL